VLPGSPAAAAGLQKDDLILAVDTQVVRSVRDYQQVEQALKAGQAVRLTLKRGTEVVIVSLTPNAVSSNKEAGDE
jgi:S1-C subfamily serine protease